MTILRLPPKTWHWFMEHSNARQRSVKNDIAKLADRVRKLREGEITEDDLLLFIYNL